MTPQSVKLATMSVLYVRSLKWCFLNDANSSQPKQEKCEEHRKSRPKGKGRGRGSGRGGGGGGGGGVECTGLLVRHCDGIE